MVAMVTGGRGGCGGCGGNVGSRGGCAVMVVLAAMLELGDTKSAAYDEHRHPRNQCDEKVKTDDDEKKTARWLHTHQREQRELELVHHRLDVVPGLARGDRRALKREDAPRVHQQGRNLWRCVHVKPFFCRVFRQSIECA